MNSDLVRRLRQLRDSAKIVCVEDAELLDEAAAEIQRTDIAVSRERERCAMLVENMNPDHQDCNYYDKFVASRIRFDSEPGCRDCADNNGTCPHDGHKCGT